MNIALYEEFKIPEICILLSKPKFVAIYLFTIIMPMSLLNQLNEINRTYPIVRISHIKNLTQVHSVVAKKLGCWLKIQLRRLKEGAKHLVFSAEVPVVLYQVITN